MTSSDHDESPGRILVVDDDLVTGHFLVNLLGDRGGFDVSHTPDPAAALERATSETWDLVLTDVEMPGMTGLELLQALRRVAPDLPVAVLTSHASLDNAVARAAGPRRRVPAEVDAAGSAAGQRGEPWSPRDAPPGWRPGSPCWPSARTPMTSRSARPARCSCTAAWATRSRS